MVDLADVLVIQSIVSIVALAERSTEECHKETDRNFDQLQLQGFINTSVGSYHHHHNQVLVFNTGEL